MPLSLEPNDSPAAASDPAAGPATIALTATFTAEGIAETLAFWVRELGWHYEIRFAPYNQVFQQLLDAGSLLAANRHGVNFVLARIEDWARFGDPAQPGLAELEEHTRRLIASLESAARSFSSPLIVAICPASPGFLADPVRAAFQQRMEALVESSLAERSSVHTITPAEIQSLYPVAEIARSPGGRARTCSVHAAVLCRPGHDAGAQNARAADAALQADRSRLR